MRAELMSGSGRTVLEELSLSGNRLYTPCGGRGTCGKCRIRVIEGDLPVTPSDRRVFSQQELDTGFRLACRAVVDGPVTVEYEESLLYSGEDDMLTGDDNAPANRLYIGRKQDSSEDDYSDRELYAAIDLGTTTIVIRLTDSEGEKISQTSFLNPLGRYGADVLSRMKAQSEQKLGVVMSSMLRLSLNDGLKKLLTGSIRLSSIIIAGNTAMIHLLMNRDCKGMCTYPFTPVTLEATMTDAGSVLGESYSGADLYIFPAAGAFIGGDVVAGLYGLSFGNIEEGSMMADLGTNAEIVLKASDGKLLAASAAAGPALEGGHLSCGTGYVSGAVTKVVLEGTTPRLTVAGSTGGGHKEPVRGLCGSGALELLGELLRSGIVDSSGRLSEEYEDGFVFGVDENGRELALTQIDIRELQLAKGAVAATVELLADRARVDSAELRIHVSGALGSVLPGDRAHRVGLFPRESAVIPEGNTVLKGITRYVRELSQGRRDEAVREINEIVSSIIIVEQNSDRSFEQSFIMNMTF